MKVAYSAWASVVQPTDRRLMKCQISKWIDSSGHGANIFRSWLFPQQSLSTYKSWGGGTSASLYRRIKPWIMSLSPYPSPVVRTDITTWPYSFPTLVAHIAVLELSPASFFTIFMVESILRMLPSREVMLDLTSSIRCITSWAYTYISQRYWGTGAREGDSSYLDGKINPVAAAIENPWQSVMY